MGQAGPPPVARQWTGQENYHLTNVIVKIVKLYYCRENVMPLIWKLRLQQKTIDCVCVIWPHTLD